MINKLLKVFFLTWLFISLFYSKTLAITTIELKESVSLSGEEIFLKDIAKLSDTALDTIYIGKLPLPGRKRYITQEYVRLRILQAKIKEENFKLIGAKKVEITSSYQKLDIDEVIKIAENYLLDKINNNNYRIEIKPLKIHKNIILPPGKVEFDISPIDTSNLKRQVYLPVNIIVNGTKYCTVRVEFRLWRFANVVVSAKPLPRNYIITPLDVKLEEREVTYITPTTIDEVIGKRLKTSVTKDRILTYDLLEIPPLISQGDIVTIKKEDGLLVVCVKGIAKQDGRLGDKIQVKNIDSKKIISGIVWDEKTVVVK